MIVKELTLHNFGIYASTNTFSFNGQKPIVLIGGMNGRGKTTFLEAVLLALYGSNSFAYKESHYKTYGQYLKSYVNKSDSTCLTYIELTFSMDGNDASYYKIHREWKGDQKRTSETIHVEKDGKYNGFLTDNWTLFIENILPSGLSTFFFFDGEKIAELAVGETSNQIKESIKSLLGISVLDTLKSDLNRLMNKTAKSSVSQSETEEVEKLRKIKEDSEKHYEAICKEIDALSSRRTETQIKLDELHQEYTAKGGELITQRQELFRQRAAVTTKIESCKEQLILDSGSELPLVLVVDILQRIRQNAENANDTRMMEIAIDKILTYSKAYQFHNSSDSQAVQRFVNYILGSTKKIDYTNEYVLSDATLHRLQVLLDSQLNETQNDIREHQRNLRELQEEQGRLDSYLSVDIDEKAITKVFKKIKETEQVLIDLDVQIEHKNDELKKCNSEVASATSLFNKYVENYLRKVELNDDSDRLLKYSHIANTIIDEYKIRLQKRKIDVVAATMTACFKKLAKKRNLIDNIKMDANTLDIYYVDAEGYEVNKASLSAGEKQLMVISLLWALALCSKKKLPVIIDTPLSRLDSAHRTSLITTYFPNASDQTIILSTDSEIDLNYYKLMKENVGDEFTLVYDDATKSTTIKKGYFAEGNV